jgi:hypothetical protein
MHANQREGPDAKEGAGEDRARDDLSPLSFAHIRAIRGKKRAHPAPAPYNERRSAQQIPTGVFLPANSANARESARMTGCL